MPKRNRPADFGCGFYLTDDINFALNWAKCHEIKRYNGEAAILVFLLPSDFSQKCSNVKNLFGDKPTVKGFRSFPLSERPIKHDIIAGPICLGVKSVNEGRPPIPSTENQYCLKTKMLYVC